MQSLDLTVLEHLCEWLGEGRTVWLVTVTRTFGASPRPPGSMLAMRDDGVLVGSVSGGCIEDDLIERRASFSAESAGGVDSVKATKPIITRYGVTALEAQRFGLPCGGALEVIIELGIRLEEATTLLAKIKRGDVFTREVNLENGQWRYRDVNSVNSANVADELNERNQAIISNSTSRAATETPYRDVFINDTHFVVKHGPGWRLLIIGASEIAVYLAEIVKTLDFSVSVNEPREIYRQAWRVADTTFIAGMPDDAVTAFCPDARSVIIAVSHDLKLDDMALMAALKTNAFYVGAVGSASTSEARCARLTTLDVTNEEVMKLHAPVGLDIGSRTPPEIAVSIAAELVLLRKKTLVTTETKNAHKVVV